MTVAHVGRKFDKIERLLMRRRGVEDQEQRERENHKGLLRVPRGCADGVHERGWIIM